MRELHIASIHAQPQPHPRPDRDQHHIAPAHIADIEPADQIGLTFTSSKAVIEIVGIVEVVDQHEGAARAGPGIETHRRTGPKDRTLALKLFAGKHTSKAYPTTQELLVFGTKVCNVKAPAVVLQRLAEGMQQALQEAKSDDRIPAGLLSRMQAAWLSGLAYAE